MTTAAEWAASYTAGEYAFVLVVEGIDLAFTTHQDLSGIAWWLDQYTDSERTNVKGGLDYPGALQQSITPFAAKVEIPSLSFSILDAEDDLLSVLFGEASASNRTTLTAAADSNDTTITVADTTGFSSSGNVWIGNELIYHSGLTGTSFTGCTRGRNSVGSVSGGTLFHFGRRHPIGGANSGGNFTPTVTDSARTWFNRGVGLYLIHKDPRSGSWDPAAVSGEGSTLLYAGRIKAWAESGDGKITLDTVSVAEILQTTLLPDPYRAQLQDGVYVTSDQLSFRVEATKATTATPPVVAYYRSGWVTLNLATPGFFTHDEIAAAINEALNDEFVVGADFPATATCSLLRPGGDSSTGLYEFSYVDTAGAAADRWIIEIGINPDLAKALGFDVGESYRSSSGGWVSDIRLSRVDAESWLGQAKNPPLRAGIRVDGYTYRGVKIYTSRQISDGDFIAQPTIPSRWNDRGKASASAGTEGFLRIRNVVFPVQDNGDGTFTITGWAFYDYAGAGTELATRDDVLNVLRIPDDGTAEPIECQQVWIEEGRIGDLFAKLILSTGTAGYNSATYDVYAAGMAVGLPYSLVDVDSILGLGDAPYTLVIEKPTPFLTLLESALNLTGRHLVWRDGQLAAVSLGEETTLVTETVALTEDNKAAVVTSVGQSVVEPTQTFRSVDGIINRATLRYQRVGDKWLREITVNNTVSQADHEQTKAIVVDGYGVYEGASGLQGAHVKAWESSVVATSLALFARPMAYFERTYDASIATAVYPGARCTLTDNRVVNPATGTRGVSGVQGWIISSGFDWRTGVGRLRGVFSPDHSARSVCAPAPSARVDDTASAGGYTRGYDSATKRLKLKSHEYSRSTEAKDLAHFSVGDKVRVVQLDATAPNAWADTIAGVDSANDYVTLTTGLGTWGATGALSGYYVLKFDDVATVAASQYARHAFQSDEGGESRTGVPLSGPVFGAGQFAVSSDASTYTTRYRKISNTEDIGKGLPVSVHNLADVARWTNTAASYHRAPVFATLGNWRMTWRPSADTDWHLLAGPIWVPYLYGDFGIDIWAIVELETTVGGTATSDGTLRVVASSGLPRGTSTTFESTTYTDGPSEGHYVDITVDNATADPQVVTGTLASLPMTSIPFVGLSGCWVTVEGKLGHSGDRMRIITGVLRRKAI